MVAGQAAFVVSRVELAKDVSFTVLYVPNEGARVSHCGERFNGLVARVVDTELDGLDADFIDSE